MYLKRLGKRNLDWRRFIPSDDAEQGIKSRGERCQAADNADYIELLQEFLSDRKEAKQHVMEKYNLEEADAEKLLDLYWK